MAIAPKGRPGGAADGSKAAQSDRTHRIILPSLRVAEFKKENVGEYLAVRKEALRVAQQEIESADVSDAYLGMVMGQIRLRRNLTGITEKPVQPIYRAPGFDADAARAQAEAQVQKLLDVGKQPPRTVEDLVALADAAAQDEDAMKASAKLEPATDMSWDEDFLHALSIAPLGSVDAVDFQGLVDFVTFTYDSICRAPDPKAAAPRRYPLRA